MGHLLFYPFLAFTWQISCAKDINCTVEGNIYSIPPFTADQCHYRWTNSSDYILANQKENLDGLVKESNNTTLVLHECLETVYYTRDCISEGVHIKATCTTDCRKPEGLATEGTPQHHWMLVLVFAAFGFLMLALCYRALNNRHQ
ncbi:uncharacterized protein KZ484_011438 [Pholidichthys leucotaenia]